MDASNRGRHSMGYWLAVCLALGIIAFYLWTEHRAHAMGALPYLLFLACPLIHIFMHRAHGGHGPGADRDSGGHAHSSGGET